MMFYSCFTIGWGCVVVFLLEDPSQHSHLTKLVLMGKKAKVIIKKGWLSFYSPSLNKSPLFRNHRVPSLEGPKDFSLRSTIPEVEKLISGRCRLNTMLYFPHRYRRYRKFF